MDAMDGEGGTDAGEALGGRVVGHPEWDDVLGDSWGIAGYIASVASDEVDEEFIAEYFRDQGAVLRLVPIDRLVEGDPDHNVRSGAKERRYVKLGLDTMPPLVADPDGTVRDGNHRLRVARAKGATHVLCYVACDAALLPEPGGPVAAGPRRP